MTDLLKEVVGLVLRHAHGRRTRTAVPGVSISRTETPSPPRPDLCEPSVLFVLQGEKRVMVGSRVLLYGPASHFVYAVHTPATGQIVTASAAHPYLAIGLRLDLPSVASLVAEHPSAAARGGDDFATGPVGHDLLDALRRMLRLIDQPHEIPVLAPMIERELRFRLLQGPQGARLRRLASADGRLSSIRRATHWLTSRYAEPVRVEHLAGLAHMSRAAFHRHFRAATGMSPIQYQKQVRLLKGRELLVTQPGNVARVAFAVGYQSASQFTREYARHFGAPPARDAARLLAQSDDAAAD